MNHQSKLQDKDQRPTEPESAPEAEVPQSDAARLIRRLFGYVSSERRAIAFALLSMVVLALCRNYPILAAKYLLEDVLLAESGAGRALIWLSGTVFVAAVLGSVTYYVNEYFFKWMATRVMVALRADLMEHLLRLPLRFFHEKRIGHLVSRLTNDVQLTYRTVNIFISEIVFLPIMAVTAMSVAIAASWRLSIFVLLVVPLVVYPVLRFGKKIRQRSREGLESLEDTTEVMMQTISGMRIVKAFHAERAELERFVAANDSFLARNIDVVKAKAQGRGIMDLVYNGSTAAFLLGGGWLVVEGKWGLGPGDLVAFVIAMAAIYRPIKRLAGAYNSFQESLAASARLFELLDAPVAEERGINGEKISGIREGIRIEGVSFAYERGAAPVLDDVSFEIRRGEIVALVGHSGSGKSTIADLIAGFYRPESGRITVDGVDLWSIDRESYLERVALVSQTPFIFNTTIRENILYGRPGASEEDMVRAASAARIHEVVAALPLGYDTVVGERGATLSGGERQRVTIARAILKDADLLILDEATSSLDSQNERLVQAAIDELASHRTALIIAHRLSTVRRADRIVVLEGGRVVEVGSHDELLARDGAYSGLHEAVEDAF